ncbi:MAG: aldehyde ferredoxin oxidoreductase family protein [bacterium]|nr:MAG: aldehyde ferredoxin oxidoreductase family protein [bacterium]
MLKNDPLTSVLYINLTTKQYRVEMRPDLFEAGIGGTGVATSLLAQSCPEGCDPLGPDNPIVLAVGPMTGLFPLASKTVAMFKSPHTGNLGESHCGGRSAVAIRMAGYGAIVIEGRSQIPVYLAIHGSEVHFRDASTLWGMTSSLTVGRVIREREPGTGLRTIMRIGAAGEKMVTYACVAAETYRHFGRLGLGAVFGSKNLKAIVVSGRRSLPVADDRKYRQLYKTIHKEATASPAMKKYHDLGTPQNVLPLNRIGAFPTRNLQAARFDQAENISGEAFAEKYLGRRLACSHCPVACIHIAALREPHEEEPYFYKTSMISYDYEPIYAMGSMLGVGDPEGLLRLLDRAEVLGLDLMTTGPVLSWATEAMEKGLISAADTDGLDLKWGDWRTYLEATARIVEQPNDLYRALARGVEHASSIYGGEEFALALGGNEMPGYHTGPAAHAGCLAGARHSHLDNAGYSVDQKVLVEKALTPQELAEVLVQEESWRQVLSSLVICFFAREIFDADTVVSCLEMAGYHMDAARLREVGREIHREKYRFKVREGFSLDGLRIPGRLLETGSPVPSFNEEYLRATLKYVGRILDVNPPPGQ